MALDCVCVGRLVVASASLLCRHCVVIQQQSPCLYRSAPDAPQACIGFPQELQWHFCINTFGVSPRSLATKWEHFLCFVDLVQGLARQMHAVMLGWLAMSASLLSWLLLSARNASIASDSEAVQHGRLLNVLHAACKNCRTALGKRTRSKPSPKIFMLI